MFRRRGVEDHFAVGVSLKDRGGHFCGDWTVQSSGDDSCLVRTVGAQNDLAALHDVFDAERETAENHIVGGLGLAPDSGLQLRVHTGMPANALERRAGLVETQMAVFADAQYLQINTPAPGDSLFE